MSGRRRLPPRNKTGPLKVDLSSVERALQTASNNTLDDWLELGSRHDEVAERYQFGDKAQREYEWSLVAYRTALHLDATSFEASYNVARVLDELASAFYEPPKGVDALKEAIAMYRQSLTADEATEASLRKDASFGLAQALSTLAQHLADGALDSVKPVDAREIEVLRTEALGHLEELERLMISGLFEDNDEHRLFLLDVRNEMVELLSEMDRTDDMRPVLDRLAQANLSAAHPAVLVAEQPPSLDNYQELPAKRRSVDLLSAYGDALLASIPPRPQAALEMYEEAFRGLTNRLSPPKGLRPHELPALQSANCYSRSEAWLVIFRTSQNDHDRQAALAEAEKLAMQAFQVLDASRRDWPTEKHRRLAIGQITRVFLLQGKGVVPAWQALPSETKMRIINDFHDDDIWTDEEEQEWTKRL